MRFLVRKRRSTPAVIIVALIDVLIVLVIFLLVTTTFKQQVALRLKLPDSSQAKKEGATDNQSVIVSIDPGGIYYLGKLPVTFERQPNAGLQADGIELDTLGLFTGPEFVAEESVPMPPQIILFLENLWDFADGSEKAFRDEVRTTLLHELGHYLGLDEDELTERGLE